MIALGGKNAWREFRKSGGIVVVLQWLEIPSTVQGEPPSVEPCMILRHENNQIHRGTWVIPLDSAWVYREPRQMVLRARQAAIQIGLSDTTTDAIKVVDAIHDHFDDLIKMPPAPDGFIKKAARLGEGSFRINGQVASQFHVHADGTIQ